MAFKEDEIEEIRGALMPAITTMVNGAAATQKKLLEESAKKLQENFGKTLSEQLAIALKDLKPAEGDGGGDGGKGGKGGKGEGRNLEFDTLRKQHADAMAAITAANERTKRAEDRRREIERNNRVDGMLSRAGVTDPFMREVAASYFDRKGRVVWEGDDEEAKIVWNGDDGVQVGFDEGFASWAKSEEAKRFLPAQGKGGSGSRPGGKPPETKKEITNEDVGNFVLGLTQGHTG